MNAKVYLLEQMEDRIKGFEVAHSTLKYNFNKCLSYDFYEPFSPSAQETYYKYMHSNYQTYRTAPTSFH